MEFLHLYLLIVFFFGVSLSGFGIGVILAFSNDFGSDTLSSVFWECLRRIGVNSSQNIWDCRLSSMAWRYSRLDPEAAQDNHSGSLIMWGQRLCSIVGQGCWLGSLPDGHRIYSVAAKCLWPGFPEGQDLGQCPALN